MEKKVQTIWNIGTMIIASNKASPSFNLVIYIRQDYSFRINKCGYLGHNVQVIILAQKDAVQINMIRMAYVNPPSSSLSPFIVFLSNTDLMILMCKFIIHKSHIAITTTKSNNIIIMNMSILIYITTYQETKWLA